MTEVAAQPRDSTLCSWLDLVVLARQVVQGAAALAVMAHLGRLARQVPLLVKGRPELLVLA